MLKFTTLIFLFIATSTAFSQSREAIGKHYQKLVAYSYQVALDEVTHLDRVIKAFVAKPSAQSLRKAKEAWIQARLAYGSTEAFRFYDGPIDRPDNGPEGFINAWPLDEAYIDGIDGQSGAGIINRPDLYPKIDRALLRSLNEKNSETNIATGYHAIEFLLWGQDSQRGRPNKNSAGMRTFEDYLPGKKNSDRRAQFLNAASEILIEDLRSLVQAWSLESSDDNYGKKFLTWPASQQLKNIFTGIGTLTFGEIASERMFVAVDEGHQEHEQSCFSDMTHLDLRANLQGISNVLYGSYATIDFEAPHHDEQWGEIKVRAQPLTGPNLMEYLERYDPKGKAKLTEALNSARRSIDAIPVPFDESIIHHQDDILKAVTATRQLGIAIKDVAAGMGVTIALGLGD